VTSGESTRAASPRSLENDRTGQSAPLSTQQLRGQNEILVVAVEASADLHGAAVLRELKAIAPQLRAFGAAGPLMRAEGCEALVRAESLSVMGLVEVLPAIPRILRALNLLSREARARAPRLALLIDSPDFNLRLARRLSHERIPVAYFIGPSVWAWRTYRVKQIARDVLRMLVILPFEAAFYARHGVGAIYVGNPLADRFVEERRRLAAGSAARARTSNPGDRERAGAGTSLGRGDGKAAASDRVKAAASGDTKAVGGAGATAAVSAQAARDATSDERARALATSLERPARALPTPLPVSSEPALDRALQPAPGEAPLAADARLRPARKSQLGLDPARPLLALLPGSRRQELKHLWPTMLAAAQRLRARDPALQLAVPVASSIDAAPLRASAASAGLDITFLDGKAPELLGACDAAVVTSGTATLEAALHLAPLVIVYRLPWLSWLVGKLVLRVKFIGLPNLITNRAIVPELIQGGCTPASIEQAVAPLLVAGAAREQMREELLRVREELAPPGAPHAARRVAEEIAELLGV